MKLVISDLPWAARIPLLQPLLRTEWSIAVAANDLEGLLREIPEADAMIGLAFPKQARVAAKSLKLFQFPGAGAQHFKSIDFPAGCVLCNVYEHDISAAEYTMTVMLLHVTRLGEYSKSFREGKWDGSGRMGSKPHDELFGKTVGLIGYGHIGQAVASRVRAFGMRVFAVRQHTDAALPQAAPVPDWLGSTADLNYLLENADFVIIACPLSEETQALVGADQFRHMKTTAMLINPARAEIVEEDALFNALHERKIAAAALDAWYRYPTSVDQIFHGSRFPFHELPNVICTPHLAAYTEAMIRRRLARVAENLDRLTQGQPLISKVLTGTWRASSAGA